MKRKIGAERFPWQGDAVAAGDMCERAAGAVFHDEVEGTLVQAAVEEADDMRVLEFGDDGHLAFEWVHGAGVGLGAGEHDFHHHFSRAALLGICQIDRAAAATAEFATRRKESRGLHYSLDHPQTADRLCVDTVVRKS
jgi:hypothetical protein